MASPHHQGPPHQKTMITELIKHESENCRDCGRAQEGYFGSPWVRNLTGKHEGRRQVHVYSLCSCCFQTDSACAEAEANDIRFTAIGTGIDGIESPLGARCPCGCVTHAYLGLCIQCSKNERMLTKAQAEAKLIDKLLKELRAEIRFQKKDMKNGN